jgi:cytochrome c5
MRHLTIPVALAVLFTVAGCGKSDNGSSGSSSSSAAAPPPAATSPAPAPSTAAAPAPAPEAAPAAAGSPSTAASSASGSGGSSSSSASGGTATASAGASGGNGEAIYGQTCVACHGAGVAGAPKIGDKADWGPRIAQGNDTLYTHALQGFQGKKGVMPPKGGNTAIPDADVKAAVDFMVSKAQ